MQTPNVTPVNASVLVVEDNFDVQLSARLLLKKHFSKVDTADKPDQLYALLKQQEYQVILLDMNFTKGETNGREGMHWLQKIRQQASCSSVILMTAFGDVALAIDAIKAGAFDFVLKPWENQKFLETIFQAIKFSERKKSVLMEKNNQHQKNSDKNMFVAASPALRKTVELITAQAKTGNHLLFSGPPGSGKLLGFRLLAEKLNLPREATVVFSPEGMSARKQAATLFGDAYINDKTIHNGGLMNNPGLKLMAIRQLSLMEPEIQVELFNRLSGLKPADSPGKARVILMDDGNDKSAVTNEIIRADLFNLFSATAIHFPELKSHPEDIMEIAAYYLGLFADKHHKSELSFSRDAWLLVSRYHWPGNVAELKRSIERAVVLCDQQEIVPENLVISETQEAQERPEQLLNLGFIEKQTIKKALLIHRGNISHASRELGLTRAALYRRMEKYDL